VKLTTKQQKFVTAYVELGNATSAALKAGYSKRTARSIGQENLTKPDIKAAIDERMKKLEDAKIMKADEAMKLLTRIARGEEKETVVVSGPDYFDTVKKEADIRTRIGAIKEILKRYPTAEADPLFEAQVRKAKIEADLLERQAKLILHPEEVGDQDDDGFIDAIDHNLANVWEGEDKQDAADDQSSAEANGDV
jgi:phage terminase small subunit